MKKLEDNDPFFTPWSLAFFSLFLIVSTHLAFMVYQNPPGTANILFQNGIKDSANVPPSLAKNIKINGKYPVYEWSPGNYMLGTGSEPSQIMQVQVTGLKFAW